MSEVAYHIKDCYELQLIDCNCNNCFFMERDFVTYKKWEDWNRDLSLKEFERVKTKAIVEAQAVIDNAADANARKSGEGMLRVAQKMKFQFDKKDLLQYGKCKKFKKDVSFIPMVCQLETQECFVHRKDG